MAKASDILGKTGGSGFGPAKPANPFQPAKQKSEATEDHSITKKKPEKDAKPHGGGGHHSGIGAPPTSVRPKV
jgi:hypothetical protein